MYNYQLEKNYSEQKLLLSNLKQASYDTDTDTFLPLYEDNGKSQQEKTLCFHLTMST